MSIKNKDLWEFLNKHLTKSKTSERLLIRSANFLRKTIKNFGMEDNELKKLINRLDKLIDALVDKIIGMRDLSNFLLNETRKLNKIHESSEKLLKKLDAQQMWLFENIDDYVDKALEARLKILLEKKNND